MKRHPDKPRSHLSNRTYNYVSDDEKAALKRLKHRGFAVLLFPPLDIDFSEHDAESFMRAMYRHGAKELGRVYKS